MLSVFITIDTEFSPRFPNGRASGFVREIAREIDGDTADGQFGLAYQLGILDTFGLRAVFFVESLFASAIGLDPLRRIVGMIQDRGHEVQLHLHPEWLSFVTSSILTLGPRPYLKDYTEDEQTLLIARGIQNLRDCGVRSLCAFRAGKYGANFDTLRALERNGLLYDTSHNTCYLGHACDMDTTELLLQPTKICGVYEFPISFFRDGPGHYRHLQLCACSSQELINALTMAWERGWYSLVLVSHSFELIKRRKQTKKPALVDRVVLQRFERLCRFLAENRDKFRTAVFSEIVSESIPEVTPSRPLHSGVHRTLHRYYEQLIRRIT